MTRHIRYGEPTPFAFWREDVRETDNGLTLRALAAALSRPVRDAQQDTPEDPGTLRKRLKAEAMQEALAELRKRIRNPAPPTKQPPQQAQHVRAPDPGLDVFFAMAEQQRGGRRGG
jgi:hypothetical protein